MEQKPKHKKSSPVIGISIGDINGIGPEVIIKSLSNHKITKHLTPVIFGSAKVLSFYRKSLNADHFNFSPIDSIDRVHHRKVNVIDCWKDPVDINPGESNETGGNCAFQALEMATNHLIEGKVDALVTAPINKHNIQRDDFKFPGHTEYLSQKAESKDSLMYLISETLRVGVVTGHMPLKDVSAHITQESVEKKLKYMLKSLKKDFGISKPKIAVMGLNPHAGEEGLLGTEEADIIKPAMQSLKHKGNLIMGPYPSDGFFGSGDYKKYDGILAMYHDQGLIPFKTLAFEDGVNFTAGLPFVRTSPDHGTAYSIAGKGTADERSMRAAIFAALDISNQRKEEN